MDPAHSVENRTQLVGAKLRTSPRSTLCLSSPLITSNQQKPNPGAVSRTLPSGSSCVQDDESFIFLTTGASQCPWSASFSNTGRSVSFRTCVCAARGCVACEEVAGEAGPQVSLGQPEGGLISRHQDRGTWGCPDSGPRLQLQADPLRACPFSPQSPPRNTK